jgi:predicted secreted protein
MSAIAGKNGAVNICATGGAAASLCNVTNWKISETTGTIDTSGMCDDGVETFIAGPTRHTVSVSAKWETDETDIVGSPPVVHSGAAVDYELFPDDSLSDLYWSGSGIITSYSVDCPYDGLLTFELEIQGSGELTHPSAHT